MRGTLGNMPLVKLLFPFIGGILLYLWAASWPYLAPALYVAAGIGLAAVAFVIVFPHLNTTRQIAYKWLQGPALALAFVCVAFVSSHLHNTIYYRQHFSNYLNGPATLTVLIAEPPAVKPKTVNTVAQVQQLYANGQTVQVSGKIYLSFLRNTQSEQLAYGNRVTINATPKPFAPPQNPGEFNYRAYQANRQIHYRAYVNAGSWQINTPHAGNPVYAFAYRARHYFTKTIQQYVPNPNSAGIAAAMLLGHRAEVDDDTLQAYAGTGAMHVLSVSGLHVGILFIILQFLFGYMDKRGPQWATAKTITIIGIIWAYALLAGLGPSVMRSAAMFSVLQLGSALKRYTNTYNTLAGSALLLLLANPFVLTNIGFQLSYLAVLGIVVIYQPIYNLLTFKNKIANYAWQVTAVSIAAQIATAPISLFYFHQFPNMFLLANVPVAVGGFFIMVVGLALLAVGWVPIAAKLLGALLGWIIALLNQLLKLVSSLPYSLTQGISFSATETILLYVFLLLLWWYAYNKKAIVLMSTLAVFALFLLLQGVQLIQQHHLKQLVVYSIKQQHGMAYINSGKIWCSFDEELKTNRPALRFHVLNHWAGCGATPADTMAPQPLHLPYGRLYKFGETRVAVITGALTQSEGSRATPLPVDYLVLSGNTKLQIVELQKHFSWKQLIIDSSVSHQRATKYVDECSLLKLTCWNTLTQGAWVKNL